MSHRRPGMAGTALLTMSAPVLWGTTYIVISEWLPAQRPLLAAAWRVAPAGIVLIAVGLLVSRWRPHRGDWRGLTVLAIFNFGLFFPLLIRTRGRPGRRAPRCRVRPGRRSRRSRGQRVVRGRCRADETVSEPTEPACRHGVAATPGRRAADPAGASRRRKATAPDHAQSGRVHVPESARHRARVRAVVQRDPSPSKCCTAAARAGRTRDRSRHRLGRSAAGFVCAATHRLQHDRGRDRLRSTSRESLKGPRFSRR